MTARKSSYRSIASLQRDTARFVCGSVVFCDGGSDAVFRPDAL